MKAKEIVIPAQIRAARALLEWSQEELATQAGIGLSTVRDVESQRRPLDTAAATEICRALQNAGVVFVPGAAAAGPGVRFVGGRPHVIKPPTVMTMWDGMPFDVEWEGRAIRVFVTKEAMDDLGRFRESQPDAIYAKTFDKYRGSILEGVAIALAAGRATTEGRLRLKGEDIAALA